MCRAASTKGWGWSSPEAINGLRVEHVAARLQDGADGDILTLAIDAGFGSKATFNRVFKERFGVTPSTYRRVSTDKNDAERPNLQRTT
ncbi:helix-turn-helix domain-containing protein [Sphingomonas aurantiaca]|uniref:helix-turn-helix domain-containing protein n=1 Tax=Sphingomonas aurantiaca TaxID=185949 RepID=UPI002FE256C0